MQIFETKSTGDSVSDVDRKQGIVTGYLSAFGNVDADGDVIRPGAFLKTVAERGPNAQQPRIKHLLNHDTTKIVGKFTELKEDSFGLRYTAKIGSHDLGRDYLKMVEDGLISEHSIGFKTVRDEKGKGVRYLDEIKLYEGSGLTFLGSNPNTPIISLKSFEATQAAANRLEVLRKAYKDGDYSDEAFDLIQIELLKLQQLFIDTTPAEKSQEPGEAELKVINHINNYFKKIS